jgi:hypothetical protein
VIFVETREQQDAPTQNQNFKKFSFVLNIPKTVKTQDLLQLTWVQIAVEPEFMSWQRHKIVLFPKESKLVLGPTQTLTQLLMGALTVGVQLTTNLPLVVTFSPEPHLH